jgi:hypothetical protein
MPRDPLIPSEGPGGSSDEGLERHEPADIAGDHITLPESYNQNRLVLLPVNTRTQHLYWQIDRDALRQQTGEPQADLALHLLLLEPDEKTIETIPITHLSGSTYTYHDLNFQKLQARLIARRGESSWTLLQSAIITTPSGTTHASPWEIWITKGETGSTTRKSEGHLTPGSLSSPSSLDQSLSEKEQQMRAEKLGLHNPSSDQFSSEALLKKRGQ